MKDINLFRSKGSFYFREVKNKEEVLADLDCDGFLVRSSERVARSIIASLKDREKSGIRNQESGKKYLIAFVGGDDSFNRRAVETLGINYLVSAEALTMKDTLKQRDSGLNHVVAKKMADKGTQLVVDMGEISKLISRKQETGNRKQVAIRISKIIQNVRVCRKAGARVLVGSFGRDKDGVIDEKGRRSFLASLGGSSEQVAGCVRF